MTTYKYSLTGDLELEVVDEIGPFNTWSEVSSPKQLIFPGGRVASDVPTKVLLSPASDGSTIVILEGASWDSVVGDSGSAQVFGSGASARRWTLTKVVD